MTKPDLGKLERVDLREAWTSESEDFTPWLADNLDLLGDALGVALELEGKEVRVGPFSADILCRDLADGHWVLIENQLEKTDHTHLGQIITYAAGLDALTVVWVASEFVDEHRAALDWLNDNTSEGLDFFGVEVQLWRIDDSRSAPELEVVCRPNAWTKGVRRNAPAGPQWDEVAFFEALDARDPRAVEPARRLLLWGTEKMTDVWWGRGKKDGSFVPWIDLDGATRHLFAVYTYGRVAIWFQYLRRRPPFDALGKREELLARLNRVPGVSIPAARIDKRPSIQLADIADPASTTALLEVFDWAISEMRAETGGERG